jgi:hypothetical protein
LSLRPDAALADAPPLDILHVPGSFGQQALMEDTEVLGWMQQQAAGACRIFSLWREETARRVAAKLGIPIPAAAWAGNDLASAKVVWREPRAYWRTRQRRRS